MLTFQLQGLSPCSITNHYYRLILWQTMVNGCYSLKSDADNDLMSQKHYSLIQQTHLKVFPIIKVLGIGFQWYNRPLLQIFLCRTMVKDGYSLKKSHLVYVYKLQRKVSALRGLCSTTGSLLYYGVSALLRGLCSTTGSPLPQ